MGAEQCLLAAHEIIVVLYNGVHMYAYYVLYV